MTVISSRISNNDQDRCPGAGWPAVCGHASGRHDRPGVPSGAHNWHVMEPLVIKFVKEGYHNVPDNISLSVWSEELIRAKGYRDKDIEEIAEEAARAHGMSK